MKMLKITRFLFVAASCVANAQTSQQSAFEKQAEINAQQSTSQRLQKSLSTTEVIPAGTEKIIIMPRVGQATTVTKPPQNAPVVIFQGRGGVVTTIDDTKQTATPTITTPRRASNQVVTSIDDTKQTATPALITQPLNP